MKKVTPIIFLMLAQVATLAVAALISGLRPAYLQYSREPEDLWILVTLTILSIGLGTFWATSGIRMLKRPVGRLPRPVRFAAWLVLLVGGLFLITVPFAENDAMLSYVLALACVASAAAVLSWG